MPQLPVLHHPSFGWFWANSVVILKGQLLLLHRRQGNEMQADRTQALMSLWRGEEGQSSAGIDW